MNWGISSMAYSPYFNRMSASICFICDLDDIVMVKRFINETGDGSLCHWLLDVNVIPVKIARNDDNANERINLSDLSCQL